jgi:hypothetical protein
MHDRADACGSLRISFIGCVLESGPAGVALRCAERAHACPRALRKPEAALRSGAAVSWPTPWRTCPASAPGPHPQSQGRGAAPATSAGSERGAGDALLRRRNHEESKARAPLLKA